MKRPSKEDLELELKQVEIIEKQDNIDIEKAKVELEKRYTTVGLIYSLSALVSLSIVDQEQSIPGCDPRQKPAFSEGEIRVIKDKLFKVIGEI